MPTSNQKKPRKASPSSKKTASSAPEDSSKPEPHKSEENSGCGTSCDGPEDLRLRGNIQLFRGTEIVTNLQVDFLFPGILDTNSLADADMRFSAVSESVITEVLNRKVRALCEKLLATHKGYSSGEDDDFEEFPPMHRPSDLPPTVPELEDAPDNPAAEEDTE